MPYVVGKTATIRQGKIIPGGQPFEVSVAEAESMVGDVFEYAPDKNLRPNFSGIKYTPGNETERIPGNFPGENPVPKEESFDGPKILSGARTQVDKPMGNTSRKVKTVSKVSSKKEG